METLFSVVIPARDEARNIGATLGELIAALDGRRIPFEVVVVDDHSVDDTSAIVRVMENSDSRIRLIANPYPDGIGNAIRAGLDVFRGEAVAIVMADASDSPDDVVAYHDKIQEGWDAIFGSRFIAGGSVENYPPHKYVLNRVVNRILQILFWVPANDITNAFKCYRREVIRGIEPILSPHFNITVELPLKTIVRGYSHAVIPIRWRGRKFGVSRLRLKEMGSRYLFIILHVLFERLLVRQDYRRREASRPSDERIASR